MKLLLSVTLLLSFSMTAYADYYSWRAGYCHRFSNGHRDKGKVADHRCGPDYYSWRAGSCHRFSGGHRDKGRVADHNCGWW